MIDQEFYSVKEVAVIFAVNEKTIRRAIKRGWIPAIRIGQGKSSPYRIAKYSIDKLKFLKETIRDACKEIPPL